MVQIPGTDSRFASHSRTLPRPATGLIGREAEVMEICARFQQGARLVTLTGPGGVGKTRVALAVAERLNDTYPSSAGFVSLAPIADHRLVIPTIARTIGIMEQPGQPILDRLIDSLRDRRMLLVLDNVEHVVKAANSVAELLRACQHLSILATSRVPLHITGEREYAVPPLPLPVADPHQPVSALSDNDAVRLFVERASGVSSTFVLTEAIAPAVSAICHRVGGLPLAIELAAARIKLLSPEELLARIDLSTGQGALTLLTGGPRDTPGRQQTMRDTIQWSHDLLVDDERRAFRQLSVFAGGWTLDAAEAVIERADIFEMLASLVDKSLVQRTDRPGQPARYWMLEPIRQFGLEMLAEHGDERGDVRRRHAMYVLALVEGLDDRIDGPDAANWYERIETEHDNVRAALRWAMEGGEVDLGLHLVAHVAMFWDLRGYVVAGLAHIESFLDLPAARRWTIGRGLAAYVASRMNDRLGRTERVVALADEAYAIFEEHGDDFHMAQALLIRGFGHFQVGDDARAQADWELALPLLQVAGSNAYTVRALIHLSELARRRGDLDQARALVDEGFNLARAAGSSVVTSLALKHIGLIEEASGNTDVAADRYRERMRINRELSMPWATAQTLEHLARYARRIGQFERAACLLASAAVLRERSGSPFIATDGFEIADEVDAVRDALPDDVFQAAWSRGQSMTMDEASAYALQEDSDLPAATENPATTLTRRELDVLRLLVDGKSNQEIASDLFISPNTVNTHVANIMNKLGLDSRTAVATWAVRSGIA